MAPPGASGARRAPPCYLSFIFSIRGAFVFVTPPPPPARVVLIVTVVSATIVIGICVVIIVSILSTAIPIDVSIVVTIESDCRCWGLIVSTVMARFWKTRVLAGLPTPAPG